MAAQQQTSFLFGGQLSISLSYSQHPPLTTEAKYQLCCGIQCLCLQLAVDSSRVAVVLGVHQQSHWTLSVQ